MKMDSGSRMNLRMQNFVTGLLIVVLLGGVAFATHRYQVRWDWTTSSRHTLAEQSVKAIKQGKVWLSSSWVRVINPFSP
ncbi:MAG: hypothetical protein G8345_21560, partial [Magnetococcales bacterium]|nr:hypothetical protein [Magnetococcales bacterium]